jgi:hypothetical protein
MLLNNFFQNAYVTHSLDFAVEQAKKHHGIEKFIFFEPDMEVYTATHGHGPCKVKVALAWIGDLQLEFIEPVSGLVHHYLDYLPKDKSDKSLRFHHMCMRWANWDEARAEVDRKKWKVAYEGGVDGVKFVYLDARETLGHYLEYLWASDEMWAYMSAR